MKKNDDLFPIHGYFEAQYLGEAEAIAKVLQELLGARGIKVIAAFDEWGLDKGYNVKLDIGEAVSVCVLNNEMGARLRISILKGDKDRDVFFETWKYLLDRSYLIEDLHTDDKRADEPSPFMEWLKNQGKEIPKPPLPDYFKSWEHMENDSKKATPQEQDLIYYYSTTSIKVKDLKVVFNYSDMYSKISKLRSEYPNAKICSERDPDLPSRDVSIIKWHDYIAHRSDERKAHEAMVARFREGFSQNTKRVAGAMRQAKQDDLA